MREFRIQSQLYACPFTPVFSTRRYIYVLLIEPKVLLRDPEPNEIKCTSIVFNYLFSKLPNMNIIDIANLIIALNLVPASLLQYSVFIKGQGSTRQYTLISSTIYRQVISVESRIKLELSLTICLLRNCLVHLSKTIQITYKQSPIKTVYIKIYRTSRPCACLIGMRRIGPSKPNQQNNKQLYRIFFPFIINTGTFRKLAKRNDNEKRLASLHQLDSCQAFS